MEENKKSASPKKNCAYSSLDSIVCIKGGMSLPAVTCHNRPSEAHRFGFGGLQAALRLRLRLHGVNHNMPSQMARGLERCLGWWSDGKGAGAMARVLAQHHRQPLVSS